MRIITSGNILLLLKNISRILLTFLVGIWELSCDGSRAISVLFLQKSLLTSQNYRSKCFLIPLEENLFFFSFLQKELLMQLLDQWCRIFPLAVQLWIYYHHLLSI
jgi:hypothetical protein